MTQNLRTENLISDELRSNFSKVSLILGTNTILGGVGGLVGVLALAYKNVFVNNAALGIVALFSGAALGAGLGVINTAKFGIISAGADFFKPEYSTEIKVGANLAIDAVVGGGIGYAVGSFPIGLGAVAGLALMDGINCGIESYFDHQEAILSESLELVS